MNEHLTKDEYLAIADAISSFRFCLITQRFPEGMEPELRKGVEDYLCKKADDLTTLEAKVRFMGNMTPSV